MSEQTSFGNHILLLAAHPDDEVVSACATLQQAAAQGAKISVLFLTTGCVAKDVRWFWDRKNHDAKVSRRLDEAQKIASFLGFSLLSRPTRPARHLWREMEGVYQEIQSTIKAHAIDQIWCPAYEGGNADHDALNAVCSKLANVTVLEFAEYNFDQGRANSNLFPKLNGTETTLQLSPQQSAIKRQALALYVSEQNNLFYVKTTQESFRPLARYDYSRTPHEGTLWYTRFHWVPFKHPRIDFSDPKAVSSAIQSFLNCF